MAADAQPHWRAATVVATEPVAQNIQRITIERPPSVRAQPGTHIDVQVDLGNRTDHRSYSVVSSNEDGSVLAISVLLTRTSRGGSIFMHRLQPGDTLMTTQPLQNFPLRVGAPRYVVLAGGIGITAVLAMVAVLKSLRIDYTVVYVARSREAMAYLPLLAQTHGDRLVTHIDAEGTPLDVAALIDDIAVGPRAERTELYMCGPIRLMDAVRREWIARELPIYNLRYETFGNSGWFDPEEFVVRVPRIGLETRVGTHTTILEALTDAGADLMFDCRKGECGLCVVDVLQVEGTLDHRDVFFSDRQREAGTKVCTCVSRTVSRDACSGRSPIPAANAIAVPAPGAGGYAGVPVLTIDIS